MKNFFPTLKIRFSDMSIRNKYIIVSIISLLISFSFLSATSYYTLHSDNKEHLLDETMKSVNITTTAIDNILSYGLSTAKIIAPNDWIQDFFSPTLPNNDQGQKALVKSFLNTLVQPQNSIDSIIIYGLNGQTISSSSPPASSYSLYEEEFQNDVSYLQEHWGGTIFTTSVRTSPSKIEKTYISIRKPIISIIKPRIIAIVEINYSEDSIAELMAVSDYKEPDHLKLIDYDGNIIIGEEISPSEETLMSEFFANENVTMTTDINSSVAKIKNNYVYMNSLKNVNWKIISFVSLSAINRQANRQLYIIITIIILALIISIMGAYILSDSLTRPIRHLCQKMEQVGTGDLTAKVIVSGNDEIGKMSIQFNNMLVKISALIDQVTKEKIGRRESQLLALQAQINPHFLYNTLTSISSLIELGYYEDSQSMLHSLETFYKTSLSGGKNVISLYTELKNITSYLHILQYRYDNFTYEIICPEELKKFAITKLTIQPLVENSIHHGLRQQLIPGKLKIEVKIENQDLFISVIDNGPGIPQNVINNFKKQMQNSYGLYNVDERIKLYFGQNYGLIISENMTSGACVTIHLPAVENSCEPKFIFQRSTDDDKNIDH